MDISTLENWLWEAACSSRGPLDAPKYKDYILPLLFYKRLCDVFPDELDRLEGVIDWRDFNATEAGQRLLEDNSLARLVEPDLLGRAYEYLLRKFAWRAEEGLSAVLSGLGLGGWKHG